MPVVADFQRGWLRRISRSPIPATTSLTILLGAANLVYTPKSTPATGSMPAHLALGNFSGTGNFDLAVGNAAGTPARTPSCWSRVTSTFTADDPFPLTSASSASDFNNDGITDLVAINDQKTTLFLSYRSATAKATLTGVDIAGTGIHQVAAAYQGDLSYPTRRVRRYP